MGRPGVGALLERDQDLAGIAVALDGARVGTGACVLVEGPAGIGKTALLDAVASHAADAGFRVLRAAGGELETDFAFGLVRQLFGPVLADGRPWTGAAALARPVLEMRGPSGAGIFESLHGLFWLTADLAAARPLALVVDDGHWCDGASLRFLLYLQRRLEGLPAALVVAARPGEPGGDDRLLGILREDHRSIVVRPAGLSLTAVAELLSRGLGEDPDDDFARAVHAATGGNPFLVGELVTALADRRVRPVAAAVDQIASVGPEGVQRVILRRLHRVGPDAVALARAAAVLGGGAEVRHAVELADIDPAGVTETLESLVRA
jgi:predicted ATPase